ncbi:MAG: RdgB/HAM1 family non-canonical purine NTP pyrophosphatase [Actinomycetota bacterium]
MTPTKVALASRNPGKLREIRSILAEADIDLEVVSSDEFPGWVAPIETEPHYAGNALLKARSLASFAGIPALADDSGIEVDALGGGPGVRSARFAGEDASDEDNLRKLIDVVRDTPEPQRTARYRCVAVLVTPDGVESIAIGHVEGDLITEPRGSGGFGYDPIFVPDGETRTMAELAPDEKDKISHRGKAFRGLVEALRSLPG